MDEIIYYFIEHWRGELSVSKSGWFSSIIAILLVLPTNALDIYTFLSINNFWNFADVMAQMQMGNFELKQVPLWIDALNQLVETLVLVWWAVGAWRACYNPNNNRHGQQGHWSLKITIVTTAALQFYDLADFITSHLVNQPTL